MARGVYDVYAVSQPLACGDGGGDCDTPFSFIRHPVHGGFTVMHLSHFMKAARVVENTLGNRGFTGVYMGDDADVSSYLKLLRR